MDDHATQGSGAAGADELSGSAGELTVRGATLLTRDTRIGRITAMVVEQSAHGTGAHAFYRRLGYEVRPHRFIKDLSVL